MKIVLHELASRDDGMIDLIVSFGEGSRKAYRGKYDTSDVKCKLGLIDHDLFMTLSDASHNRFGDCTVYQMEVMSILVAFRTGDRLSELPVELGTTRFSTFRPGRLRVIWNKLKLLLYECGVMSPQVCVDPDWKKSA